MERKDQVTRDSIAQRRQAMNEELMIDEDQLYAGPRGQLRQWFDEGGIANADYMIVGSDTFDNTLFPIYTNAGVESTTEAVTRLRAGGNRAMEVYDLHADRESQILAPRTWNNEQARSEPARSQGAYQVPTRIPGQPSGGAVSGAPVAARAAGAAAPRGASSQAGLSSFDGGRIRNQPSAAVSPGSSSQAGLSSYVGGQAKSLPSVPPPGQPGSRFNPVVVSREEQASRRGAGKKSLAIGTPPGLIQGIPPEIKNSGKGSGSAEKSEESVIGASTTGFMSGFMAAQANVQVGLAKPTGGDGNPNPSWRANNQEADELSREILSLSDHGLELMGKDIASRTDPSDAGHRDQMRATRDQLIVDRETMLQTMAENRASVNVETGAYTDADMNFLRASVGQLREGVTQMRAAGLSPEDAKGTPGIQAATDAVQRNPEAATSGKKVVMNRAHLARLEALDGHRNNSLEHAGGHHGR